MPEPRTLTRLQELLIRAHYGKRSLEWIGDRIGGLTSDSPALRRAIWAMEAHHRGKRGGTAIAPAVVSRGAIRPFISPPTREQLMAGSANTRRVYKIED